MIRYITHAYICMYINENTCMCYCHKPLSSYNTVARAFLLCLCINRCTCSSLYTFFFGYENLSWGLPCTLQWRHNGRGSVSNHQPHDCLLNRWFRRRSKKTSKLRVTGHCAGNSPGTGEFPVQMASNAENVPFYDVIMDKAQWRSCEKMKKCNQSCAAIDWHIEAERKWPPFQICSLGSNWQYDSTGSDNGVIIWTNDGLG